jgi:hypothetical protein
MATKCETQFYDALNNYNHRGEKPKWDDVTDLIGKWQKALDSVGIARWDQVNINDVRKVDTALTSNERRIRELRTGLDAILDKHISEQVKAEHRKFIANYRNESAVMYVLAEMTTIASQKTDTPSATDMVVALRDLLARPADNSKIGLSLEEQQHVQFAEYFNNLVVGKIYERIPEARITKLFNDKQFVDDLVAEMHRTQQQFNTKQYVSKNTDAQAVADILNDALAQMNLRLTQLGRKTPFSTRNLLPNFNWQRIRSWIKERGDAGENDFVTFFAQRLDNDMDEAVRQEVAQQVLDSLKTTQGYIDWDSVVENVQANAKNTPIKQRIQFKDGQSWNELNDAFGERDFMSTMITQFKYGSKQIAIAQMFGPDWQRNWNEIQNRVRQAQVGNERIFSTKEWRRTQNTFDRLTASPKVAEGLKWQSLTATGRSLEIASKLGSAVITALMDAPTAINVVTRLYGNSFMRNIDSVMSGFTQRDARQYAERLNIGVDGMMGALQDRFMMYDDWQSMNVAQRKISNVSNFIMKVSGLETWTDMFRACVTALFRKVMGTLL